MAESPTFERLARMPTLSDAIAERLLEAMMSGRLREGDVLPSERELGLQFGVSRTVIREAVRTLVARGLLDVQPGRGVRVVAVSTAPVIEAMSLLIRGQRNIGFDGLHEVRTMLETHIASIAARRSAASDHAELEQLIQAEAKVGGDVAAASELDVEFHRTIAKSTGNVLYVVLLDSIAGALLENRRATLALDHSTAKVIGEHRAILDGITEQNPELARAAMEKHLAGVASAWHGTMGERGKALNRPG